MVEVIIYKRKGWKYWEREKEIMERKGEELNEIDE